MAKYVKITTGSIFVDNPVTLLVTPSVHNNSTFHRVIAEVHVGVHNEAHPELSKSHETIKLSAPVTKEGTDVSIDISSAIRVPLDDYEYTPEPTTYPVAEWNVRVYDEYMDQDGEVHSPDNELWFPANDQYYRGIRGRFSDMERLLSDDTKGVQTFTRKPSTLPQIVVCGEMLAYTPAYKQEQILPASKDLKGPQSMLKAINFEGVGTIDGQSLYALPTSEMDNRQSFRFINSFGVLESINVPRASKKKLSVTSNQYAVARLETFNTVSHGIVHKQNDYESWQFVTDPLDEAWLSWYLHEFLMAQHIWMRIVTSGKEPVVKWLRVHITPEEDTTFLDSEKNEVHTLTFTARLDINGSPLV